MIIFKENEEKKCKTLLEKFVFSMKYMHTLKARPESFMEDLLRLLYNATELGSMTIEQRERYEETMRNELDISLEKRYVKEEAFKEGLAEGEAKGREDVARKMLAAGIDVAIIKEMTDIDLS